MKLGRIKTNKLTGTASQKETYKQISIMTSKLLGLCDDREGGSPFENTNGQKKMERRKATRKMMGTKTNWCKA